MIGAMLGDPKPMTWNITKLPLHNFYTSDLVCQQVGVLMNLMTRLGEFPEDWPQGLSNPLGDKEIVMSPSPA